jgi:hypothetical protein
MGNHYHLLIETPEPNLVEGMKWVQNTYTRRFNVRHREWGRVFGDRYKAVIVEGDEIGYYSRVVDYIHLNAVRAGLVKIDAGESVLDYPWSSVAGGYAWVPSKRPKWLAAAEGLERLGYSDTVAGRREMVENLDRRAIEEGKRSGMVELPEGFDARRSHLRRGWYWGSEAFAEKLIGMLEFGVDAPQSRAYQRTPQQLAHGMQRAEEMVVTGMRAAGLEENDLNRLKGSDPRKVELVRVLRRGTTVSLGWIAKRLAMKSSANVGHLLRTKGAAMECAGFPEEFVHWIESEKGG